MSPFLSLNQQKIGLRNIPGIKLFLIALVWSVSCVLLPIVQMERSHQIQISAAETLLLVANVSFSLLLLPYRSI